MSRPHVVIIGAGFAGLNAARSLRRQPVEITIIDRRNFHLFQPLLYQVAAAALNPSDIAYPIRSVFRRQGNVRRVLLAEVVDIDRAGRRVSLDDGSVVGYDYLVVAAGATHSYFGNESWADTAPGLKSLEDALTIRRRVLGAFEEAEKNPEDDSWLSFVVVGAGPTGVELAGALIEIALHAMGREFHTVDPSTARVYLVEGAGRVLPTYAETLSVAARLQLESLGVTVITGDIVSHLDDRGVTLASGERIPSRTVIWAAGVEASGLGGMVSDQVDRAGRVNVGPDLSVATAQEIFVAGDLAAVEGVPGVAPAAIQMGRHVASAIEADLQGRQRPAFQYRDKGSVATIGRARAVADIGGFRFSGFPAWAAWLAIHIFYLIGFRNRVFVLAGWAWSYLTFRRGARIITGLPRE
jgi:NADH dehydrogenase